MPRRAEVQARPVEGDGVYSSPLVTQVIHKIMLDGKKSVAEQIVYEALETVGSKSGRPPVEVLEQAVKTVTPVLEVRGRRVGGANYQVPVEVPQRRARTLAVRWLVTYARARGLYRRGGAKPPRPRRRRRRVRRRRRRAATVRDRLASGRQVQGSAHRFHQQDGPHRRELLRLRAVDARPPGREPGAGAD